MAKAQAVELFNELDGVAGCAATHAVIKPFCRSHDKGRLGVLVEGTRPGQMAASVFFQVNAARAD